MAKKKPSSAERRLKIETLKADVDRLRNTMELIRKVASRADFITDEKLKIKVAGPVLKAFAICEDAAAAKVAEAKKLSLAEIDEETDYYEGNKGTRRLER